MKEEDLTVWVSIFVCVFWSIASENCDGNVKNMESNSRQKSFLYARLRWFLTYARKCISAQNGRRKHICRVRFDMANTELR